MTEFINEYGFYFHVIYSIVQLSLLLWIGGLIHEQTRWMKEDYDAEHIGD